MSAVSNEDHEGSGGTAEAGTQRLLQDSNGVGEIHKGTLHVGSAQVWRVERKLTKTAKGDIDWYRLDADKVSLTKPASILLLQGGTVQYLFSAGTIIKGMPDLETGAGFLFLRGQVSDLWSSANIYDAVFARVLKTPPGLSSNEALGALVNSVLGT